MTDSKHARGIDMDGRTIGNRTRGRAENWRAQLDWLVWLLAFVILAIVAPHSAIGQETSQLYRSKGYGYLLEFEPATQGAREVVIYQATASSLFPFAEGVLSAEGELFLVDDDELSYLGRWLPGNEGARIEFLGGSLMNFESLAALPEAEITEPTPRPQATFQVTWELFEEYFSLFPLVQVDWRQRYEDFRPLIRPEMTEDELFDLLIEMMQPLNDGHTALLAESLGRGFTPGPRFPSEWVFDRIGDVFGAIAQSTDDGLTQAVDGIIFGSMGEFGYLNVLSMTGYSEDALEEEEVFGAAIDAVLNTMSAKKGLILDLRFNGGGDDHIALALAKRFTDRTRVAFQEAARVGAYDEYGELQAISYSPEGIAWGDRPVVLLTSRNTGSAAEIATLALGDLPNVTLIGESTYGNFSDAYSYALPNGFVLSLSPEIYFSSDDVNYEQIGYPPDVVVSWSEMALEEGRDSILEQAITFLESETGSSTCAPSPSVMCFHGGRFAVSVQWRDFRGNQGEAGANPDSDSYGNFWFFDQNNIELSVKILDGRSKNNAFWVFVGALSNVEFRVSVTDTTTGLRKVYVNPLGTFSSIGDTGTFKDVP